MTMRVLPCLLLMRMWPRQLKFKVRSPILFINIKCLHSLSLIINLKHCYNLYLDTSSGLEQNMDSLTLEDKIKNTELMSLGEVQAAWVEGMTLDEYYPILKKMNWKITDLESFLDLSQNDSEAQVLYKVVGIRRLLSVPDNPPVQKVIDAGIVPILVDLLGQSQNANFQLELLWALTNIWSGTSDQTQSVVEAGAIDLFLVHLNSPSLEVVEQALWGLGNMAGDNPEYARMIYQKGGCSTIFNLLKVLPHNSSVYNNWTWCSLNIIRAKLDFSDNEVGLIWNVFLEVLGVSANRETISSAIWGLSHITDQKPKSIEILVSQGPGEYYTNLLYLRSINHYIVKYICLYKNIFALSKTKSCDLTLFNRPTWEITKFDFGWECVDSRLVFTLLIYK